MRSGPELSLKAQIAVGIVGSGLCLWVLPAVNAWIESNLPPAPAQESATAELARRYAAALAACFNGQQITDGKQVFECRRK